MTRIQRLTTTIVIIALIIGGYFIYRHEHNKKQTNAAANLSVAVFNQTQNSDGTKVTAHPNDTLVYTLVAANPSNNVISGFVMEVGIGGTTNSSTLIDAQGASYNSSNNSLVWTPLDIPANGSIQKQFKIRVNATLPTATSDRQLSVTFNNQVVTNVDYTQAELSSTPTSGTVGSSGTAYVAPKTGIPAWVTFLAAAGVTFGVLLWRVAYKLGRPQ